MPSAKIRSKHLEVAKSVICLLGHDEFQGIDSPEELHSYTKNEIEDAGYEFVIRRGVTRHQRSFTIVMRRKVRLVSNWAELDPYARAVTLAHELTHVRQRKTMGHLRFVARYALAPWRWAIEIPALRSELRGRVAVSSWTSSGVITWLRGFLPEFYDAYRLKRIPYREFETRTMEILQEDLST